MNIPVIASIRLVTMLAIQFAMPSKIQSRIVAHLLQRGRPPFRAAAVRLGGLPGVLAAGDQWLQVSHDKAHRVQDDPGDDDALQPAGRFIDGALVA